MATLIHLNGPPGIGKSTLAARFVDERPGTLNLDLDRLLPLFGGWRDDTRTYDRLRPVAWAMAAEHLRGGHDVIVPQFIAVPSELDRLERVAGDAGAAFCEVVLLTTVDDAIARFLARADADELSAHKRENVDTAGGASRLASWHADLEALVAGRPGVAVVHSLAGDVAGSYAGLLRALGDDAR